MAAINGPPPAITCPGRTIRGNKIRSDYFYGTVKAAHFAILTARSARAHKQ